MQINNGSYKTKHTGLLCSEVYEKLNTLRIQETLCTNLLILFTPGFQKIIAKIGWLLWYCFKCGCLQTYENHSKVPDARLFLKAQQI